MTSLPPPYEPWRPPEVPPPPAWPPPPDPQRQASRAGLMIGVVAVVLLVVCGGLVAAGFAISRLPIADSGDPSPVLPVSRDPVPTLSFPSPTATVEGGPSSFELPMGTAVRFSDRDGDWSVTVLGAAWIDECEDFLGGTGRVLVLAVRVESLLGAVSVIPFNDFTYLGADGVTVRTDLLSACSDPPLDYTIISAGQVLTGTVTFPVPSGVGGELQYGQFARPTASWLISER